MKKIFFFFALLFTLLLAGIYIFVPGKLVIANTAVLHCSVSGANRVLQQKDNWKRFWPGNIHLAAQKSFTGNDYMLYKQDTFRITQILQNALFISIANVNSTIILTSLSQDSLLIKWSYETFTSVNPFTRIKEYQQAVATKKNISDILISMKIFLSKDENIYGLSIAQTSTKDTVLVSTKAVTNTYPSTQQIYSLINRLQNYVKENDASQTGFPMVNIMQLDKNNYSVMTALPVNKSLKGDRDIAYKFMIPGRFLTTTVTGGNEKVNNAYNQLQQYFQDYNRTSMAIPFMYLITDRSQEPDTSKWVTKLYFPVM